MRELSLLRDIAAREARRAMGRPGYGSRHYPIQSALDHRHGEVLMIPEDVENLEPIQNTDGSFVFMLSYSALGGPDGLA